MRTDKTLKDINYYNLNQILLSVQKLERKKNPGKQKDLGESEGMIRLHKDDLKALKICLENDTKFLEELDIMDYSLYVVVEHLKEPLPPPKKVLVPHHTTDSAMSVSYRGSGIEEVRGLLKSHGPSSTSSALTSKVLHKRRFNEYGRNVFVSKDRTLIYHIGIIDYLQEWNSMKKMERFYK